VSRMIAPDLVYAAAGARGQIRLIPLAPSDGTNQASVDQRNVGRASEQIAEVLQDVAAHFPNARAIHLFIAAPVALLTRAAMRLATIPVPVTVHEFFKDADPSPCYLPMTEISSKTSNRA
ncbi:MAG: hypothetical protein KC620_17225, partial [Myxococcales bacterium]|nr:hypothetical protein [Myxococcales bacterium]